MRKMYLLPAAAMLLAAAARADDPTRTYDVETIKGMAYYGGEKADKVRHQMDLYLPKGAKDYPTLFFIHGGAWRAGSKDSFSKHGNTFAKHGIAFVATNYRLSPAVAHPEHVKDVAKAFAKARAELGKRGADLKRIFGSGHSAGGHLAALLATDESYLKEQDLTLEAIRGCAPISGVFTVGGKKLSEVFGDAESSKKASPLTYVREKLPPFLIFYADKEIAGLGAQAEAFGKAMKKAGAKAKVVMVKDRDHGTIMRNAANEDDEVTKALFAFIASNGEGKEAAPK